MLRGGVLDTEDYQPDGLVRGAPTGRCRQRIDRPPGHPGMVCEGVAMSRYRYARGLPHSEKAALWEEMAEHLLRVLHERADDMGACWFADGELKARAHEVAPIAHHELRTVLFRLRKSGHLAEGSNVRLAFLTDDEMRNRG